MKCLNCENEAVGKSKYCSDKCKVAYNRNKSVTESATVTPVTVTKPTVTGSVTQTVTYTIIDGQEVYHRQAVSFAGDDFETRPIPLFITDKPVPQNRGMYITTEGIKYLFDCQGHPFKKITDWQSAKPFTPESGTRAGTYPIAHPVIV
jgi:hypothetical protein